MELPPQISFQNMSPSAEIEDKIAVEIDRLEDVFGRIMSCRVVVDAPHRHHKVGNFYQIRIDLKLPGAEIAVRRDPAERVEHRDIDMAIRDAFDEARRQLEDRARVLRGHVKAHDELPHARVARVLADRGYGFLETGDGREIYFHKNSVLDGGFSKLELGTEVRFAEEQGDKGPQASTVYPVGRHGGR
jgi:cold shock CspA family protein